MLKYFEKKILSFLLIFLFTIGGTSIVFAQKDTLILQNNDVIVGKLKSLKNGVAKVKTEYSDTDFKIEWNKIKKVHTSTEFIIMVQSGKNYSGKLKSYLNNRVSILEKKDTIFSNKMENIIFLKKLESGILSNFSGAVSIGYNYTKADNLSVLTSRTSVGYRVVDWGLTAKINYMRSTQKGANKVERMDASLNYQYYLQQNWFTLVEVSWMTSTEQNINLRTMGRVGFGKNIIASNNAYWGIETGLDFNGERLNIDPDANIKDVRNSGEFFFGTELNLFVIRDFRFSTRAIAYPSFTESKRWRFDYDVDLKYDLPLDFFINFNLTLNYDSRPVINTPKSDLLFQVTFGWDFN